MRNLGFWISFVLMASLPFAGFGQLVIGPNVAIKPIASLSVKEVNTVGKETSVVLRIVNNKQLPPFTLKTRDLYIRPVSDHKKLKFIRAENAPFAPEKHVFTTLNEVFEFTLVFEALPKGTKYFDLMENNTKRDFYIQGIILDTKLNELVTKGFAAFTRGDGNGALKAFIEMAEADLYFEYGLAYFNIIFLLANMNRVPEAQIWYDKFQERFFYDKALLESEFTRLGIKKKLNR